ncbi:Coronatine-insensitive protein 1 [Platanthera guangdongensis]|uniref:Coronatine-insensitive protein 1 n=1 Tax=Platanthera guangdongensis TaxID=2320717 RepID=A0ABR2MQR6_9ASPA
MVLYVSCFLAETLQVPSPCAVIQLKSAPSQSKSSDLTHTSLLSDNKYILAHIENTTLSEPAMDNRKHLSRALSFGISDLALDCVMGYINHPYDRGAISLVCKKWHWIDCLTQKHVTIAICYSTMPQRLRERFPRPESLKLKGKPRAAMFFNLIPGDWGGYAGPWVNEVASQFSCLKSLHLR